VAGARGAGGGSAVAARGGGAKRGEAVAGGWAKHGEKQQRRHAEKRWTARG
jgi:hypothetical protein